LLHKVGRIISDIFEYFDHDQCVRTSAHSRRSLVIPTKNKIQL
jgi:hypothetical protein